MNNLYYSGPVSIQLRSDTPEWHDRAAGVLGLYTHWGGLEPPLSVYIHTTEADAAMVTGSLLRCVDMHVDKSADGLYATCRSGAYGRFEASLRRWDIFMPKRFVGRTATPSDADDNLEDLLELVLTTAWREAGWIPLHAGAVVQDSRCAILTAPSRGGKTTLTIAMLHRGWETLGDDKLLVKLSASRCAELYALQSVFNIDPQTRKWFPEVGDLSNLPLDSVWTPKRRLPIERIWEKRMVVCAEPTHLVQIQRYPDRRAARAETLSPGEVLSALLHQTVVPIDRRTASQVISVVAALAKQLRGVRLELGMDAYEEPRTLDLIERILE